MSYHITDVADTKFPDDSVGSENVKPAARWAIEDPRTEESR